jgi:hypothetical protein
MSSNREALDKAQRLANLVIASFEARNLLNGFGACLYGLRQAGHHEYADKLEKSATNALKLAHDLNDAIRFTRD